MKINNVWLCKIHNDEMEPLFCDVSIDEGIIKEIIPVNFNSFIKGRRRADKYDYNASGRVLTLPLVNFHDHIYSRLAKGVPIKGNTDTFLNKLKNIWWKVDKILDYEMIEASAEMAAVEAVKNGVTYLFDHHSSQSFPEKSLCHVAKVLKRNNLRAVMAFETTDRNGKKLSQKGLSENKSFFQNFIGPEIKSIFGLHASFTLNDSTLKEVSNFINEYEMGIHIHLCEDPVDRKISKEKNNKAPIDRLIKYNLLNEKSILSHAIHLNKREYDKIEKCGSAIAMNVDSNMNNSVGFINFNNFNRNIPLLAGTDGMHANPGRTIKNTFLLLRNAGFSFDESFDVIKKIYLDQLKFIKRYYYNSSELKKGDRADFIIWDYIPPTPINSKNFFGHFIYGMLESRIHSTVQNGIFLMKEGKLSLIDEEKAYKNIYKQGERLYSKMKRKR